MPNTELSRLKLIQKMTDIGFIDTISFLEECQTYDFDSLRAVASSMIREAGYAPRTVLDEWGIVA